MAGKQPEKAKILDISSQNMYNIVLLGTTFIPCTIAQAVTPPRFAEHTEEDDPDAYDPV